MKLLLPCILISIFCGSASGQQAEQKTSKNRLQYLSLAVNNSHTTLPYGSFVSLLYEELHPGIELGTGINWSEKKKHDWFQTLKVGYSYHRFIQHSFMFYTEGGYRYKFPEGFSANARLGAGYLLSVEDSKVFVLNDKGEYQTANKLGRSHGMATLSLGISKTIGPKGWQLFMDYQQRFQFSFIASYVPALPINSFGFGVSMPLHKK